jgi:hypothetical protein
MLIYSKFPLPISLSDGIVYMDRTGQDFRIYENLYGRRGVD